MQQYNIQQHLDVNELDLETYTLKCLEELQKMKEVEVGYFQCKFGEKDLNMLSKMIACYVIDTYKRDKVYNFWKQKLAL